MKFITICFLFLFSIHAHAAMVEDGMGYRTEKKEAESTYQKWISIKASVEKKVRVFLGVDKTEEEVQKKLAEKKKKEEEIKKEKEKLVNTLPVFQSEDNNKVIEDLSKAEKKLKQEKTVKIVSPAVEADPNLPKDTSGVSYHSLKQKKKLKNKVIEIDVKDIPSLNIGKEREVAASDLLLEEMNQVNIYEKEIKRLASPDLYKESDIKKWSRYQIEKPIYTELELKTLQALGLTMDMIKKIDWFTRKDVKPKVHPLDKMSQDELRNLQALILEKNRDCHAAVGLFYPLQNSSIPMVKYTSMYKSALCNHKMGFYHQSIDNLLDVVTNEKIKVPARKHAFNTLMKDVPYEHEVKVGEALLKRSTKGISEVNKDAFYYYITKSLIRQRKYDQAYSYALKINKGSPYYPKAQYAAAVGEHFTGKRNASLKRQRSLLDYMKKNGIKEEGVYNLAKINLARYAFQRKKMNESIKHFREMDRSHPLWIESLQELGWAQLANGDEPGAIGNMHSLHAPFFKHVYKPASHAIRSIGYLNLCHYGDAYRSLTTLEKVYQPAERALSSYNKKYRSKKANYETVKTYLTKKKKEVRGLPEIVVREVARKKNFLNLQEHINNIFDEKEQYKFIGKFINKDQRSLAWKTRKNKERIKEFEKKVNLAKNNKKYFKNLVKWQQQLEFEQKVADYYAFYKEVLAESEKMYKLITKRSYANLNRVRDSLELKAGSVVRSEFKDMHKELKRLFKNNEFLRYEVFAGSGENIRYHVAGRKIEQKRLPSSAKPKSKDLKWQYDGEFWSDEVGFYRSGLKSNCPKR